MSIADFHQSCPQGARIFLLGRVEDILDVNSRRYPIKTEIKETLDSYVHRHLVHIFYFFLLNSILSIFFGILNALCASADLS